MPRKLQRDAVENVYANAGSVRAEDLPYDATADIKTSLDERSPQAPGPADGGKVVLANYVSPIGYGTEFDGNKVVSVDEEINVYTHLTGNVVAGSFSVDVADVTGLQVGQEVMIHQLHSSADPTKSFQYEAGLIISDITSLTVTFETPLAKSYDSNVVAPGSGTSAGTNDTRAQLITVPNYGTLTLNANLTAKTVDGYSGGGIAFRCKVLLGSSNVLANNCGYRSHQAFNTTPNFVTNAGPLSFNPRQIASSPPVSPWYSAGIEYWIGGHNAVQGTNTNIGGGSAMLGGPYQNPLAAPITAADLVDMLTIGCGGVRCGNGSPGTVPQNAWGGGFILAAVEDHSLYAGSFNADAGTWTAAPGGGSVCLISAIPYAGTTTVLGGIGASANGGDGLATSEAPAGTPTRSLDYGPKVTVDPAQAAGNDIIPKSAVETLIAQANPGYSTTFVDGDLVAGVLTVNHNLGQQVVVVAVADNTGLAVAAPITYVDNNNLTIDLSVLGTLTGTWTVACGTGGRDVASLMRASVVSIGGADHNVEAAEAGHLIEMGDDTLGRTLTIRDYATHPVIQNDVWLVSREGTESVTIQAAPAVTLNGVLGGAVTITDQYGEIALRAKDPVNDIWRVTGNFTQVI